MKKAIAPLIATVILVGFAVALAALVIDWHAGYLEETQETAKEGSSRKISCSLLLNFNIATVHGEQQLCYNNETEKIEVSVDNGDDVTIDEVYIRLLNNESEGFGPDRLQDISEQNITLGEGQVKKGFYNYSEEDNGTIEEVTIFPALLIDDVIKLCGESSVTVEGPINECEK